MRRTAVATALGVVTFAALLGACSDESASDEVCDDRADLRDRMGEIADDLAAGNLGDAEEALGDAQDDLDELKSSLDDLSAEQRQELEPEVAELETQVNALTEAESVDDLSARAGDVADTAESILGQIGDSLSC
jgi:peptidoglycan hydrolase CwlO-like protein